MRSTILAGCSLSFFAGLTVKKPNIIVFSKKTEIFTVPLKNVNTKNFL